MRSARFDQVSHWLSRISSLSPRPYSRRMICRHCPGVTDTGPVRSAHCRRGTSGRTWLRVSDGIYGSTIRLYWPHHHSSFWLPEPSLTVPCTADRRDILLAKQLYAILTDRRHVHVLLRRISLVACRSLDAQFWLRLNVTVTVASKFCHEVREHAF